MSAAACTTPNRNRRPDAGPDTACTTPNEVLRCEGTNLVRCNAEGTAEITQPCPITCDAAALRCADVAPSNGLTNFLDLASGEPAINLGNAATINTDTGDVTVGSNAVIVKSATLDQPNAPKIRVFVVGSLVTNQVTVSGKNALAIVSNGDIKIEGVFAASGTATAAGPGGFSDGNCRGGPQNNLSSSVFAVGGPGGGGFGSSGGKGGSAAAADGNFAAGGSGGSTTGEVSLVPLRGGCDGGQQADHWGRGGGAIQLVSRSKITVNGTGRVAANGSAYGSAGSGGGILLEAPLVEVLGRVVANGAAGAGCIESSGNEDGRLDGMAAMGSSECNYWEGSSYGDGTRRMGKGGNGGAANAEAEPGADMDTRSLGLPYALGGRGGGGVGRIRVNTATNGLYTTGVFSPNPSRGDLATR